MNRSACARFEYPTCQNDRPAQATLAVGSSPHFLANCILYNFMLSGFGVDIFFTQFTSEFANHSANHPHLNTDFIEYTNTLNLSGGVRNKSTNHLSCNIPLTNAIDNTCYNKKAPLITCETSREPYPRKSTRTAHISWEATPRRRNLAPTPPCLIIRSEITCEGDLVYLAGAAN